MLASLALILLTVDGGTPERPDLQLDAGRFSAEIYKTCPVVLADTPQAAGRIAPDGGIEWFLPGQRGPRVACLLEACETDRSLKETRQVDGKEFAAGAATGFGIAMTLSLILFGVAKLTEKK